MADRARQHTDSVLLRFKPEQMETVSRAAQQVETRTGLNRTAWLRSLVLEAARRELGEVGPEGEGAEE
ncbi:MAG TPA: hypothetical protein VEP28_15385 [Rubrobacter sp.]|nr:hypothetical protein [Rubrobacter sp.]